MDWCVWGSGRSHLVLAFGLELGGCRNQTMTDSEHCSQTTDQHRSILQVNKKSPFKIQFLIIISYDSPLKSISPSAKQKLYLCLECQEALFSHLHYGECWPRQAAAEWVTGVWAGGKEREAVVMVTATGEETVTWGTEAEAQGTGAELGAGGLETGAGGLLQGLVNPRYPAWPQAGLSGMAAAGWEDPCQQGHQISETEIKKKKT